MSIDLTDNEIIHQVLNGNQQAFAQLVSKYQHYVFTLAYRLTQSREDAEEISQDTFVKAYRSLADFKGGSKFSTWLYTIAQNTGISFLRKKRLMVQSIDDEKHFHQLESHESGFRADRVEEQSRVGMINQAIKMLSAEDGQIITLFYKADQNLQEIGQVMGLDPNTAKVRLYRARQRMKEIMETHFSEEVANLQER